MTTKRARQHKEDTFFDVLDRKNNKINNRGGLFNKFLKEVECRPYKFRKRAYDREKEHEKEILNKKIQQYVEERFKKTWDSWDR